MSFSHSMRKTDNSSVTLKRMLGVLEQVIALEGNVGEVAAQLGIPLSTVYRQITALCAERYLVRLANGRYAAGPRLLGLLARVDEKQIVANSAAPFLDRLASELHAIVQLGTFENGMVTYRIKTGRGSANLFTKVGMQMEAYCSAIGKVLLASLPDDELAAYLATGPFIPLTERTIVDPVRLRHELAGVQAAGFALDDAEAAEGLYCLAVPLRARDGRVQAAVSVSRTLADARTQGNQQVLDALREAVRLIETAIA